MYLVCSIVNSSIDYSLNNYCVYNIMLYAAVGLSVSVTPAQISVIDVPPSNSFTLTCTATSTPNSTATNSKVFTWSKQALGDRSSTELIHNRGSVIIATSRDTSTLTASETRSGGYCSKWRWLHSSRDSRIWSQCGRPEQPRSGWDFCVWLWRSISSWSVGWYLFLCDPRRKRCWAENLSLLRKIKQS